MEWSLSFLLTLSVEMPLLLFLLKDLGRKRTLLAGLTMNGISHPLLWFVFPLILPGAYFVLIGELAVVVMEYCVLALFFKKERAETLLFTSFLVNALSFLTGELAPPLSV